MTTKTSIPRGHEALNTAVNELSSEFSDFSAANKKWADGFSDDDIWPAICIPRLSIAKFR